MHDVVVIGDQLYGDVGDVIGTHGFYVDVTPPDPLHEELVTAAVAEIAENRAAIEQAKGHADAHPPNRHRRGFRVAEVAISGHQRKLRILAEQLLTDFAELIYEETLPSRPPSTTCC